MDYAGDFFDCIVFDGLHVSMDFNQKINWYLCHHKNIRIQQQLMPINKFNLYLNIKIIN